MANVGLVKQGETKSGRDQAWGRQSVKVVPRSF